MGRKMHPAQEVYSGRKGFDKDFIGMEWEFQLIFQKIPNPVQVRLAQSGFAWRKKDKIVGIPNVVLDSEFMFNKLVKLIHIDIN